MEYVDVLDEFGNPTGIVRERALAKQNKEYTLCAHVWIINSKREVLLQKRSINKHNFAGMWDTTGGHVQVGENSINAIQREILEELGIHVNLNELEFLFRLPASQNILPIFLDIYLLEKDIKIEEMTIQKEEVDDLCYIPISTLMNWYLDNPEFVKQPYLIQLLKILKERNYECQEDSSRIFTNQLLCS